MTADQVEEDALQCWDLYRQMARQEGRNAECVPSMELWVIAYVSGVALGQEMEREACAALADGLGAEFVGQAIKAREALDDDEEGAE